jgi:N-acetyl sugar amidotransferase
MRPPAGDRGLRYCTRCVLPDSRPNLVLDAEGVCNACRAHAARPAVDWAARAAHLDRVVARARERATGWDCLIPVSGGKDSTWQTVTALERGLTPLCVTWRPPGRTEIGRRNLDNLIGLGVDHVDVSISPAVEARFALAALRRLGDPAIPMHMALFALPLTLAVRLGIPLVLWGENSAAEYGSADGTGTGHRLDAAWLRRFGVTHGTTWRDWVGEGGLRERDLVAYRAPGEAELEAAGVEAVFLGHFLPWDPVRVAEVARAHGFSPDPGGPRTGWYDHTDIDDEMIAVHHWLKWHKFGFTRTSDNLSLEIRNGRMTRAQAVEALRARGYERPDADIARFCAFTGIEEAEFDRIADGFRDPGVWGVRDGRWAIDGFIVDDWDWTERA